MMDEDKKLELEIKKNQLKNELNYISDDEVVFEDETGKYTQ